MTGLRHIALPLVLAIGLLAQLSLPWVQSKAVEAGFNAAPYICNLDGRAPSTQAQAHIRALLTLAGQDIPPEDVPAMEHCAACIMQSVGIMTASQFLTTSHSVKARKAAFPKTRPEIYHFAQGPPLGSRAPPLFT